MQWHRCAYGALALISPAGLSSVTVTALFIISIIFKLFEECLLVSQDYHKHEDGSFLLTFH